jgi:GNAT superfamily N-acetyltransferase
LLVQEAPSGEFPPEKEFFDEGRIRADVQLRIDQGPVMLVVVALSPDRVLAGHTQLVFPESDPADVYQWATLVLPEHRGHGLGLSLKTNAMQEAADLLEGRRFVHTFNRASNGPMIAVNEAMGFRPVGWLGEFVKGLKCLWGPATSFGRDGARPRNQIWSSHRTGAAVALDLCDNHSHSVVPRSSRCSQSCTRCCLVGSPDCRCV